MTIQETMNIIQNLTATEAKRILIRMVCNGTQDQTTFLQEQVFSVTKPKKNKPKLKYMKHYKGDNTEPFEVENLEQIDMTIGQFDLEHQADLKKRFLAGEFTKEVPLKSSASYIWTEEI